MHRWTCTDADGVAHAYEAPPLTAAEALPLFAAYESHKAATMTLGAVTPDTSWMPRILFGIPGRHAFRDGKPLSAGEAEFIYGGVNLLEMVDAAQERAKAQGFFDMWMRRLTSRRRSADSAAAPSTESAPAS
jgi:hypothetical protein